MQITYYVVEIRNKRYLFGFDSLEHGTVHNLPHSTSLFSLDKSSKDNYLYSRRLYKLQAKISGHAVPKVGPLYLCMFDSLGGRACTLPHPGSGLTGKKPRTRRPVKPFLGQATTISRI